MILEKIEMDLESKESKILMASIPIAVIIGTVISILAYKTMGESSAFYAIIGGVIIASIITYFLSKPKKS